MLFVRWRMNLVLEKGVVSPAHKVEKSSVLRSLHEGFMKGNKKLSSCWPWVHLRCSVIIIGLSRMEWRIMASSTQRRWIPFDGVALGPFQTYPFPPI